MNNTEYYEGTVHTNTRKPFALYRQCMPELFPCTPLHRHREFEINLINKGCADYIIGSDKFTSSEGDIIIAAPNILHAAYPHGSRGQIYDVFLFSTDMLGTSTADRSTAEIIYPLFGGGLYLNPRITKNHVYYNELQTSAENIISAALGDNPQLDMLIKSELLKMLWLLNDAGDIQNIDAGKNAASEMIRPAIEYMSGHFSEKISISGLAKEVCLSESYFMRIFREASGMSATEYLNHLRVKAVCARLAGTTNSIAETTFGCGFGNLSNFNRIFRHITGVTPREYRTAVIKSRESFP